MLRIFLFFISLGSLFCFGNGCKKDPPSAIDKQPPAVCFTVQDSVGLLDSVFLFSNCSDMVIDSFMWDFGDGATSTIKSPSHAYSKPGKFMVTLIGFVDGTPVDTASRQICVLLGLRRFYSTGLPVRLVKTFDSGCAIVTTDGNVLKLDSLLHLEWSTVVWPINPDIGFQVGSIHTSQDGNYVVCGFSFDLSGNKNIYLIKVSQSGTVLWSKDLGAGAGTEVEEAPNGDFLIGCAVGTERRASVIRTDPGGTIIWQTTMPDEHFVDGGPVRMRDNVIYYMAYTCTDAFDCMSNYRQANSYVFFGLTPQGQVIWSREFAFDFDDHGAVKDSDFDIMPDGGYVVAGENKIGRWDADGNLLWQKTLPATAEIKQVRSTFSGILVADLMQYPQNRIQLNKLDYDGNQLWYKLYGEPFNSDGCRSIDVVNDETYFILGGEHDFNLNYHSVVAKLDGEGNIK